MQVFAHYAATSDLNVWAGRTSNCFRVTFDGIAFGLGFGPFGMFRGKGGSTSTSGQESGAHGDGWYLESSAELDLGVISSKDS